MATSSSEAYPHEGLKLLATDEKFYLVPTSPNQQDVLEIDRLNSDLNIVGRSAVPGGGVGGREVCALIGIIHLLAGPYLVIATDKKHEGQIDGCDIFLITKFDMVPYSKTNIHLSQEQERDNQQYVAMVRRVLATPGFLFSYRYDLTRSLQQKHHLSQTQPKFSHLPLLERADERFVWNAHLLRDLAVKPELRRFTMPVLHGFVAIRGGIINGKPFTFTIVSRRSASRAGVRYYMRGVDEDGHVANYCETEQMVFYHQKRASFVQTRGSIPLFWSQRPTLKYKPTPLIQMSSKHSTAIQRHFDEQIVNYGQQVIVNLVDQKGSEKKLSDAFHHYARNLSSSLIGYDAFDFHKECSKMRWHRLSILLDRLSSKQDEFGYFAVDSSGAVVSVQQGVFRTNCIDCLDRTNVVQSMLGRRSLLAQLQWMHIMAVGERVEDKAAFEKVFKNVWADNADGLAKQYAGTGALKTDFTRTGKRTFLGMLKDGYNSAIRYYYNNFYDGFRQDSIDLFLGTYVVDRWEGVTAPSPLRIDRTWRYKVLPIVVLLAFSMLFISILLPSTDAMMQLLYVFFWGISIMITLAYVYSHGNEFTDVPKLVQTS